VRIKLVRFRSLRDVIYLHLPIIHEDRMDVSKIGMKRVIKLSLLCDPRDDALSSVWGIVRNMSLRMQTRTRSIPTRTDSYFVRTFRGCVGGLCHREGKHGRPQFPKGSSQAEYFQELLPKEQEHDFPQFLKSYATGRRLKRGLRPQARGCVGCDL
jgi:hypothetical protein